jgi:hypothetical protein
MTNRPRRKEVCLPFWRRAWRALFWALAGAGGTLLAFFRFRAAARETPEAAVPLPRATPRTSRKEEADEPPKEVHHADGRIEHPRVHRETRDARVGCIFALMGAAICIAALHYYGLWRYYVFQEAQQQQSKQSDHPLSPKPSRALPPAPRLEPLDRMAEFEGSNVFARRAVRERRLHGYGPTEEEGYVHIPIEQAVRQLAGKLPAREEPPPAPQKSHGLVTGGESNSGRMFRGVLR